MAGARDRGCQRALAGSCWWAIAGVVLAVLLGAGAAAARRRLLARLAEVAAARPARARRAARASWRARARVPVAGIDEWRAADAGRTTALVTGIGRRRRVFISADVVRDWSDDEIAVVVAHELAHHAHHDLLADARRSTRPCSSGGLGLPHAVVLASAAAGARPARRSRRAAAHRARRRCRLARRDAAPARAVAPRRSGAPIVFALALTGGADAFGAAIRRLGARHLAEERPSRAHAVALSPPSVGGRAAGAGRGLQQIKVRSRSRVRRLSDRLTARRATASRDCRSSLDDQPAVASRLQRASIGRVQ